jgi:hypothetical protein
MRWRDAEEVCDRARLRPHISGGSPRCENPLAEELAVAICAVEMHRKNLRRDPGVPLVEVDDEFREPNRLGRL